MFYSFKLVIMQIEWWREPKPVIDPEILKLKKLASKPRIW